MSEETKKEELEQTAADEKDSDLLIDEDDYSDVDQKGSYENKDGGKHAAKTAGIKKHKSDKSANKVSGFSKVVLKGAAVYSSFNSKMLDRIKQDRKNLDEEYKAKSRQISGLGSSKDTSAGAAFDKAFTRIMHELRDKELAKKQSKRARHDAFFKNVGQQIRDLGNNVATAARTDAQKQTNALIAGKIDGSASDIPTTESTIAATNAKRVQQAENIVNNSKSSDELQYT